MQIVKNDGKKKQIKMGYLLYGTLYERTHTFHKFKDKNSH